MKKKSNVTITYGKSRQSKHQDYLSSNFDAAPKILEDAGVPFGIPMPNMHLSDLAIAYLDKSITQIDQLLESHLASAPSQVKSEQPIKGFQVISGKLTPIYL